MKKIKINSKLNLNKSIVAKLTDNQMSNINGGATIDTIMLSRAICNLTRTCPVQCGSVAEAVAEA